MYSSTPQQKYRTGEQEEREEPFFFLINIYYYIHDVLFSSSSSSSAFTPSILLAPCFHYNTISKVIYYN